MFDQMLSAPNGGKRLSCYCCCCIYGCKTRVFTHKVVPVYEHTFPNHIDSMLELFWVGSLKLGCDWSKLQAQTSFCKFMSSPMLQQNNVELWLDSNI